MQLQGQRVAVLVEQLYQELEVWYPYYRFKEAGAAVFLVGPEKDVVYPSKVGYPARSEMGIADVSVDAFDAVVIPGGYAPDYLRRHEAMVAFVRDMVSAGKVVGAICHAGWMLVSADVVRDKRVTSFFAIKDDLIHAGATWVDEEVVQDGNIVTSRKPDDLPAFCRVIGEVLMGNQV